MFDGPECQRQNTFTQNFPGDNNEINMDIDVNMANNQGMGPGMYQNPMMPGTVQQPIIEPMQERVVNRTFMHEVPHVCPIRTRIINNHIFRHTFRPSFSCCEENTCTSIQCGSCCQFR